MNPGQEKFYGFIMARVKEGREDEAKALLAESFGKQDSGDFTSEYLAGFFPRMIALLKPESIDEVKAIMSQFGSGHTNL